MPAFLAVFGLIIGSFLNVFILRHGARTLRGRSACLSCGMEIAWFDLIPIASWVLLCGRCRACGSRISIQYPLVELATALLFIAVGLAPLALSLRVLGLLIAALLVAITVYDLRHTIIPDSWVYGFGAVAFVYALIGVQMNTTGPGLFAAVLGSPAAALPLFVLWWTSRGRWMGFGDVKLAAGIGWLLGPFTGIAAVFFAFIIGAVVSLCLIALSSDPWKRCLAAISPRQTSRKLVLGFTMKSEVPFGPFLIASCVTLWLLTSYGIDPLRFMNALLL